MFGKTVLEIDGDRFEVLLQRAIRRAGVTADTELDVASVSRRSSTAANASLWNAPVGLSRIPAPTRPRGAFAVFDRGIPNAQCSTVDRSASLGGLGRPSTFKRWHLATSVKVPEPRSRSLAIRARARASLR